MTAASLDRQTIERALLFSCSSPIVVALSGGGDSTALLHLLTDHIGSARLYAVVVDHGLREGSRADAEKALSFARALDVAGEIAEADWLEAPKRAQGAARDARYRALCGVAREKGARVIAVAQTLDDQAETVFLRAASGSTWRGLAAMSAFATAPLWPEGRDLWLARPLLAARRAALRDMLRARGAAWIEDPSNDNEAFARVRARTRLAQLSWAGFDVCMLAGLADRLRPRIQALDADAAALIASAVRFDEGDAEIELGAWSGSAQARQRALSALIAALAGAAREPEAEAVASLERGFGPMFRGATLGGARLMAAKGNVRLTRDIGALVGRADGAQPLPALHLERGAETVWDGRLTVKAAEKGWRIEVLEGRPMFCRDGARLAWAGALGCGVVTGEWLLEAHVRHILPVHPTVTGPVA